MMRADEHAHGAELDGQYQQSDDEEVEVEEEEEEEEEEDEGEEDFERHLADHHFDEHQLRWIEENFRDSANFMHSFGLKFYNDDDCESAKKIARSLMNY